MKYVVTSVVAVYLILWALSAIGAKGQFNAGNGD